MRRRARITGIHRSASASPEAFAMSAGWSTGVSQPPNFDSSAKDARPQTM
jgi:hypothetical protein